MREGDLVGGRYQVEALIGEGGMGSVWRARHTVTGKRAALKILPNHRDDLPTRFFREARAACAVEHENVVAVHDVLEEPEGPVMVMELLQGESLRDRIARDAKLSEREALRLLAPVVSAVSAAHAQGIVHRDLKPENIFVTRAGTVKVLDFGVAKLIGDGAKPITETGAIVGTLLYMAPEQAFGRNVDHRVDIWAIGAMMYELIAGRRAVPGQ